MIDFHPQLGMEDPPTFTLGWRKLYMHPLLTHPASQNEVNIRRSEIQVTWPFLCTFIPGDWINEESSVTLLSELGFISDLLPFYYLLMSILKNQIYLILLNPVESLTTLEPSWHFRYVERGGCGHNWQELTDPEGPGPSLRIPCVVVKQGLNPLNFSLPGKPTSTLHEIVLLRDHSKFWLLLSSLLLKGQINLNYFK